MKALENTFIYNAFFYSFEAKGYQQSACRENFWRMFLQELCCSLQLNFGYVGDREMSNGLRQFLGTEQKQITLTSSTQRESCCCLSFIMLLRHGFNLTAFLPFQYQACQLATSCNSHVNIDSLVKNFQAQLFVRFYS